VTEGKGRVENTLGLLDFEHFAQHRENVTLSLKTSRRNKAITIHIEIKPIDGRNKLMMITNFF
jgi:hypothetical protein